MAVKHLKPTSAGRRFQTISDFADITTDTPEKSLLEPLPKKAGRNNNGRITTRHQGGGHKRKYRRIDFKRVKDDVPAKVASIEYDPNRSARIALLHYVDGAKAYILAPQGLNVGDTVISGTKGVDIKPGNAMPLSEIPVGTLVHAVEFQPGKGAAMARSAGTSVQLMGKDNGYAVLRMPSSELRRVAHLPRHHRRRGQRGSLQHRYRQGRPQAPHGRPSDRPWYGHEPRRPPARRRRGQEPHVRTSVRHAVGQAHQGLQDA